MLRPPQETVKPYKHRQARLPFCFKVFNKQMLPVIVGLTSKNGVRTWILGCQSYIFRSWSTAYTKIRQISLARPRSVEVLVYLPGVGALISGISEAFQATVTLLVTSGFSRRSLLPTANLLSFSLSKHEPVNLETI